MEIKSGYTLLEMLLVLSVIATLSLLSTTLSKHNYVFVTDMVRINNVFTLFQSKALNEKQRVDILVNANIIISKDKVISVNQNIDCGNHELSFNERGNINHGLTITCTYFAQKKDIIFILGSGAHYVK